MKLFFFILILFFQVHNAFSKEDEIKKFQLEAKLIASITYDAKSGKLDEYKKLINSPNTLQVLKDATILMNLNYTTVDLVSIKKIFTQYPELKNFAHKFATPILQKIVKITNNNEKELANELISNYLINSNLSFKQKILLIRCCIKLSYTRSKCIDLINNIWSETSFQDENIWNAFLKKYSNVLKEESHFEQIKILLLNGKYNSVKKLKSHIKNKEMLESIFDIEHISLHKKIPFQISEKKDINDIIFIKIVENIKTTYDLDLYYNIGIKTKCNSSSFVKSALWNTYKIVFNDMIKNGTKTRYAKAYNLINHCKNFEKDNLLKQQFLSGWIQLEYLDNASIAIGHFLNLIGESKDMATLSRGHYWLAKTYQKMNLINSKSVANEYFVLAAQNPFYFYGQIAIFETDPDPNKKIYNTLITLNSHKTDQMTRTQDIGNLLTYVAKSFYELGKHDFAMFYTRQLLSLNLPSVKRVSYLYHIIYDTARPFAINMGRYGRINGVPIISVSYPEYNNKKYSPFVKAVILKESMFDHSTVSSKNAKGFMQIREYVFNDLSKEIKVQNSNIDNKKHNIVVGSYFLQKLLKRYNNNTLALASYNAGSTAVNRWIREYDRPLNHDIKSNINWIESIPYVETYNYVMRTTEAFIVYTAITSHLK